MIDLKTAILRGADAVDARGAFDPEERKKYLNASEAMSCIRKQWYDKHQDEGDKDAPEDWGYARRGKQGEKYIVECLRASNTPMLFTGDEQVQIVDEERRLSCTPDGLVLDLEKSGWVACEFKTIDPRTNRSNLPRDPHVRQVQIAAAMFADAADDFPELDGLPIIGCVVMYMDASNYNDIVEFAVPLKPKILDQLEGRARRVLDGKAASRLPREGQQTPYQSECKQRCKWTKVCGVDGAGSSTGQGKAGAGDAAAQVGSYIDFKLKEDEAKVGKAAAAEQLKAILQRDGAASLEVAGHSVSLTTRAGSISYAKVVKEHCPDVDLEPYRGPSSQVLTVK